ncbi:MAG: ATP-binding protein, partial [Pseudomonadota bacterium]
MKHFVLLVICLVASPWRTGCTGELPSVVQGILDLRHGPLPEKGYDAVQGDWLFYWNERLSPDVSRAESELKKGIPVPLTRAWSDIKIDGNAISGQGFASYYLKIIPPRIDAPLALYLPHIRRDYLLWINGQPVAHSGIFSQTEPARIEFQTANLIPLPLGKSEYALVLHASNYLEYFGRSPQPIFIGTLNALSAQRSYEVLVLLVGVGAGLLFSIKYLVLFGFRRRHNSSLWLSLLSLDIAIHQLAWSASYHPNLMDFFGDQGLIIRILFLTIIWLMPLYALLAHSLYPSTHGQRLMRAILFPVSLATALALLTPVPVFTLLLMTWPPYVVMAHLALIHAAVMTVRHGGRTSLILLASIVLMTTLLIHDVLWLNGLIIGSRPLMFNFAILLLLLGILLDQYDIDLFQQVKQLSRNLQVQVDERTRDLSETIQALRFKERELTSAYQEANLANQSKSRFLAAASHDLRQPLHAMGLQLDQLQESLGTPKATQILKQVDIAHHTLAETLNALLDISRLDGNGIRSELTHFALVLVFARIADHYTRFAAERGLLLRVKPTPAQVYSDPLLLFRILGNLVDNAIKYGRPPGILVGARRCGTGWSVEVWDTGEGIPETQQEEVFKEFVQLNNPGRDRSQGLGLGLSIVERLCHQLGYELRLTSRPQRGSCVKVRVPAGNPCAIRKEPQIQAGPEDWGHGLRGCVVLLVEDDLGVRVATRDLLGSWGCAVIAVSSLVEAQQQSRDEDINLILADYQLGDGHTGLEVIDALDKSFNIRHRAILVTGEVNPEALTTIRGIYFKSQGSATSPPHCLS